MKIKMNTRGAPFEGDAKGPEVARILREIADKLEDGFTSGVIIDSWGNNVGTWAL